MYVPMKIFVNIMEYQYIYPIEKEFIGIIYGKNYKTINYLQIENNVKIKLLPKNNKYKSRAFLIKGNNKNVKMCIILIKIISKVKNSNKLFFYDNEPLSTQFTWEL